MLKRSIVVLSHLHRMQHHMASCLSRELLSTIQLLPRFSTAQPQQCIITWFALARFRRVLLVIRFVSETGLLRQVRKLKLTASIACYCHTVCTTSFRWDCSFGVLGPALRQRQMALLGCLACNHTMELDVINAGDNHPWGKSSVAVRRWHGGVARVCVRSKSACIIRDEHGGKIGMVGPIADRRQ